MAEEEQWPVAEMTVGYTVDDDGIHLFCACGADVVIGHSPTVDEVVAAGAKYREEGHCLLAVVETQWSAARKTDDGTWEVVGVGWTADRSTAWDDVVAWQIDGFEARLQRRFVGPAVAVETEEVG